MDITAGRINKMAEGQVNRMADSDITYKMAEVDRRYSIGETGVNKLAGAEIAGVHKAEESTWHRAYQMSEDTTA